MIATIQLDLGQKRDFIDRKNKGKSLILLPDSYTVFDIETTGLDSTYDEIIEIGALKIRDNKIVEQFSYLIKPKFPIDEFITELTGITNEMVSDAPSINEVLPKFLEFIDNDILVGHNVNFDINFIYDNLIKLNYKEGLANDFVDTLRLSRKILNELNHHRLKDLADFYGINDIGSHRSIKDCEITNEVFNNLKNDILNKYESLENFVKSFKKKHYNLKAGDIVTTNQEFDEENFFYKKYVAITGTLERILRKDAMQIIVDLGGFCEDRITQKTNCLILGNTDYNPILRGKKSAKLIKAEEMKLDGYDIEIISENVFYDIISEELNEKENLKEAKSSEVNWLLADNKIFNNDELKIYNEVKNILLKNGKDVEDIRCVINSNKNFSVLLFGEILRTKLRGNKYYVVVNNDDLNKYDFSTLKKESATSADNGDIRLIIDEDFDINILEKYIVEKYEQVVKDNYSYMTNVKCGQKNYNEYLKKTYK